MEQHILCENKSFMLGPDTGQNAHDINTNTSAKIMSELILVQNNHFSKVCTIFCLFKKKKN